MTKESIDQTTIQVLEQEIASGKLTDLMQGVAILCKGVAVLIALFRR